MILGIGTDICDIKRVEEKIAQHGDKFYARILTPNERVFCNTPSKLAKRYAAKEAILKTIGTGLIKGMSWQDIEILKLPSGAPIVHVYGAVNEQAHYLKKHNAPILQHIKWHISMSDEAHFAIAYVILEAH